MDSESHANSDGIGALLKERDPASVLALPNIPRDSREHNPFLLVIKPQQRLKILRGYMRELCALGPISPAV